jgi:hypothetical protein
MMGFQLVSRFAMMGFQLENLFCYDGFQLESFAMIDFQLETVLLCLAENTS